MKKMARIMCILGLLSIMIAIFVLSSQDREISANVSKTVTRNLSNVDFLKSLFQVVPSRKLAHFTEYFLLGFFTTFTFYLLNINWYKLLSTFFCIFYACTDEFHQLFVNGRGPSLFDVCIDSFGSTLAVLCVSIIVGTLFFIKFFTKNKKFFQK